MTAIPRRTVLGGSLGAAAVTLTTPGARASTSDPYYPGSGDSQYGVSHYTVANSVLTNGTAATRVAGTTTMNARARVRVRSLDVDIALPVTRAQVNGKNVTMSRPSGRKLRLSGFDIAAGAAFTIVVGYDGYPSRGASAGDILTGSNAIAFIGEPFNGPYWHACNDRLDNKATYDVTVWTQRANAVFGPGKTVSRTDFMSGETPMSTCRFVVSDQVSSYLPTLQVGRYSTLTTSVSAAGVTIPLRFGAAGSVPSTMVNHTKSALQYFAGLYGPYPFAEAGGVSAGGEWNGNWGQETVTRPTYNPAELASSGGPALVAHEIAHQWFGNSVTGATWRDMPLIHEGFAVLLEKDYCATHGNLYSWYTAEPSAAAGNPGTGQFRWNEACGVVRELRSTMDRGATVQVNAPHFRAMARDLATTYRHRNVTRAQFKALAQSHSPVRLDSFWSKYAI